MYMNTDYLLDRVPLWGIFLITVAIVLLSVAIGSLLGRRRKRRSQDGEAAPVGAMAAAAVGLLGFLLAFTFGMAASRFDVRKGLVIDDANAIGTTYLRAKLLPEPYSGKAQALLREYVDIRVEGVRPTRLAGALLRSQELHQLLWSQAVAGAMMLDNTVEQLRKMVGHFEVDVRDVVTFQSRVPPCFKCGRHKECTIGGLYMMLGDAAHQLTITPEMFSKWEDDADVVAAVERAGAKLKRL